MASVRAGHYPKNTIWAESGDMEYDLSAGWHYKRAAGWWKNAKQHHVNLYDLHGEKHRMTRYDLEDETIVGFSAHEGDHAGRQDLLAEAEAAFKDPKNVKSQTGCGHIELVEFAVAERILRVTFTNNHAVVVYKNVPTYVAGTLLHWAKTKQLAISGGRHQFRGNKVVDRHQLGVSFWDLIHIRGHQHGSKFPFEYVSHGTYSIVSSKGRHIIRGVDGNNYLVNFNDEEYALYQDIKKIIAKIKQHGYKSGFTGNGLDDDDNGIEDEYAVQKSSSGLIQETATTENAQDLADEIKNVLIQGAQIENSLLGKLLNSIEGYARDILRTKEALKYGNMSDSYDRNRFIRDNVDAYPILELVNQRSKDFKLKEINSMRKLTQYIDVLSNYDDDGVLSWYRRNDKTRNTVRKIWTPQMLTEFGNPYMVGADHIDIKHAETYKKYIKNKDWEGALNFLKNTKKPGEVEQDSKSGTVVKKEARPYAYSKDVLGTDE